MLKSQRNDSSSRMPIVTALKHVVKRLNTSDLSRSNVDADLEHLQDILKGLPFTTQEFGLFQQRLRNVCRYLHSSETGAAKWELNLLSKGLDQWLAGQDCGIPQTRISPQGWSI